jgi:hypothetical protein
MIVADCGPQGSDTWHQARLAIPTASNLHKVLTATGQVSKQTEAYLYELLAEFLTGQPNESFKSEWMMRGTQLEPEARAFYEFQFDQTVEQVGFIYRDERKLIGCSPDGLIKGGGGLEIKVPSPGVHVRYLMNGGDIPSDYFVQVQSSIWICEADWWDWISYSPNMPPVIIRARRDKQYIAKLESAVNAFIDTMMEKREELISLGLKR